jgi:cyclohexanecarboxyl-CoA dehydrogenase
MIYFTEDQKQFQKYVRDFARSELSEGARERAKLESTKPEVLKKLAHAGIFNMTTPVEYGGKLRDCVSIGIAFEEVCAVDFSAFSLMLSHVLIPLMMEWASKDLRDEWLPPMGRAEKLGCFGQTEPDCGSDAGAIKTRAVRDGDCYVINGEKSSISGGMKSDVVLVTAKTNPAAGAKGVTCFFVPFNTPGVDRGRFNDMGAIPSGRAWITFNDVRIPASYRIAGEGEGFTKVMHSFDFARVLCVLAAVGMAEETLADAITHVKNRTAFGLPISRFEGVSFKLSEAATLIEATKLLCYQALKLRDERLPHTKEVAMAKWYGASSMAACIHELLLLFGWRGYSEQLPLEQRLRDAIGLRIGDGTAEIMKLIIARELLGNRFGPIV